MHPPEEGAVLKVGFEKLLVAAAERGEAVAKEVIFAIAVEIADPNEFRVIRAVGTGIADEGQLEERLDVRGRRERPRGGGCLLDSIDDGFHVVTDAAAAEDS